MSSQFDALAEAYESTATDLPFRRHVEMYTILEVLGRLNGLAAIDFGCGSGLYARLLRSLGAANVVGVDTSEGMINYATRREEQEQLGVSYLLRDATQLTNDPDSDIDGTFDLATAIYVLPYAATEEALVGFCRNARRALRPAGGRFVAACLNPDFSTEPSWYQRYGFNMSMQEEKSEGAPVQLKSKIQGQDLILNAYHWSRAVHERSLRSVGFETINWIKPRVSDEGRRLHGDAYWQNYLSCPQALILDARTGPTI